MIFAKPAANPEAERRDRRRDDDRHLDSGPGRQLDHLPLDEEAEIRPIKVREPAGDDEHAQHRRIYSVSTCR